MGKRTQTTHFTSYLGPVRVIYFIEKTNGVNSKCPTLKTYQFPHSVYADHQP